MTKKVGRREYIYIYIYIHSGRVKNLSWGKINKKIESKKLININNKIYKQLYNNIIVIQNLI